MSCSASTETNPVTDAISIANFFLYQVLSVDITISAKVVAVVAATLRSSSRRRIIAAAAAAGGVVVVVVIVVVVVVVVVVFLSGGSGSSRSRLVLAGSWGAERASNTAKRPSPSFLKASSPPSRLHPAPCCPP